MAVQTDSRLENQMIYSVFVRNHSKDGSFTELEKDLDRIRRLGTDILWLMPVQPTGKKDRKGQDGSPYAIADYRAIEPKMGDWNSLKHLVDEAHARGMKVIVDVVYNHTSPDSVLFQNHPDWFFKNSDGKPHSIVEEWSDIIDLNYRNPYLWDYQIETLKQFASILDGFRCDVATRIPVAFWKKAREACAEVNPDLIWLAESCHLPFTKFIRDQGRVGESDSDLYQAFDLLYDYDAYPYMEEIFKKNGPIQPWVDALIRQEATLPSNYIKLHYLENHDTDRFCQFIQDPQLWKNWTALLFMLKGTPMLYHGQEQKESHRPSIFDQDPIDWKEDRDAASWISHGARIHHELFTPRSVIDYSVNEAEGTLEIRRNHKTGLFLLKHPDHGETVSVSLPDGDYLNLWTDRPVTIQDGKILKADLPLLVETPDSAHKD